MSVDPKLLSLVTTESVSPTVDVARQVFDYWVSVLRTGRAGPKPALTDKRRRLIERTVRDYDIETCFAAIDGCALSDWHQGHNPRGRRYDEIELILRDAAHVERFATIAAESKGIQGDFEETGKADW